MAKIYAGTNPAVSSREATNLKRVRDAAAESMVLLENRGALPLGPDVKTIALFGNGARYTVKGGTGSGDVNSRDEVIVEQGLTAAGYVITTKALLDQYDAKVTQSREDYRRKVNEAMGELGPSLLWQYLFSSPYEMPPIDAAAPDEITATRADAAVYILSRNSGEGRDRALKPGDYLLTEAEERTISLLAETYGDLIVVLNVGGVIDTKFLRGTQGIGAILLMSQLGNNGGHVLADVLSGRSYPSGRLSTTWAENYRDYPGADEFGRRGGNLDDAYYTEGIYVGYRWFDAFNIRPAYPFGFGLGYTQFALALKSACLRGENVEVEVEVSNIGERLGKEVVQVYVSQPDQGMEKPVQVLAAFAKTEELMPGKAETICLSFPLCQLASYDERRAAWVLETGEYVVRVGRHSRDTHVAAVVELPDEVVTERCENRLRLDIDMKEIAAPRAGRCLFDQDGREKSAAIRLTMNPKAIPQRVNAYSGDAVPYAAQSNRKVCMSDVIDGRESLDGLVSQLEVQELAALCVGSARYGEGESSIIGTASSVVPGAAGDTTSSLLESRGIPNLTMADGPAGLRLSRSFFVDSDGNPVQDWNPPIEGLEGWPTLERSEQMVEHYQYCTAIPIATALAQSWNLSFVEEMGDLVGGEMEEFGVDIWLAPGMNIHRNPLCGRNFEYYSEDPLLSGLCAAADVRGVQCHLGKGVTIKHLACNNQEDNRQHVNSHVSERALREIYLKGFELAVRLAQPAAVMTSYNLLNGVHTANSRELVSALLRDEWGFEGLVMTDWGTTGDVAFDFSTSQKYGNSSATGCILAGNDLIMPGSTKDVEDIAAAVANGTLTRAQLEACAKRVLQTVLSLTCKIRK